MKRYQLFLHNGSDWVPFGKRSLDIQSARDKAAGFSAKRFCRVMIQKELDGHWLTCGTYDCGKPEVGGRWNT